MDWRTTPIICAAMNKTQRIDDVSCPDDSVGGCATRQVLDEFAQVRGQSAVRSIRVGPDPPACFMDQSTDRWDLVQVADNAS